MSKGVNKVILIGNLGQDPQVSQTQSGLLVANISIAVSESRRDASGQQISKTEWVRCVLFDKLATIAQNWLHKGSQVYIEGRLQTRQYIDKNNIQRSVTDIVVSDLTMLGGNPNQQRYGGMDEFSGNANMGGYNNDAYAPSNAMPPRPMYGNNWGNQQSGYQPQNNNFGGYGNYQPQNTMQPNPNQGAVPQPVGIQPQQQTVTTIGNMQKAPAATTVGDQQPVAPAQEQSNFAPQNNTVAPATNAVNNDLNDDDDDIPF